MYESWYVHTPYGTPEHRGWRAQTVWGKANSPAASTQEDEGDHRGPDAPLSLLSGQHVPRARASSAFLTFVQKGIKEGAHMHRRNSIQHRGKLGRVSQNDELRACRVMEQRNKPAKLCTEHSTQQAYACPAAPTHTNTHVHVRRWTGKQTRERLDSTDRSSASAQKLNSPRVQESPAGHARRTNKKDLQAPLRRTQASTRDRGRDCRRHV